METIFIDNQLKVVTGDNESNLVILEDDTATYKLENVKSQNENRIAKEKLQIYLETHQYPKALQHCVELNMHSSFFKVLELWIASC